MIVEKLVIEESDCIIYIKEIFSDDEKEIIEEFLNILNKIKENNSINPKIYTFSAKTYTSALLTRMIKYNITSNIVPLEKYKIVDIKNLLGNFNELIPVLNYFGISNNLEKNIYFKSSNFTDEKYLSEFKKYQTEKTKALNILTCRILKSTYTSFWNINDIVVDIETEPLMDKYDEFVNEFKYLTENNSKDKNIEFMKNNPLYSKIIGITIGKIKQKEEEI